MIGFISLEKLILADPDLVIESIMKEDFIYVHYDEDVEEAANLVQKYDLLALPVLDENDHLLGIITHDDAMDILIHEDTEDIQKFAGMTGEPREEGYLKQTIRELFKRRFTWTLIPAIMEMASGMVIHSYQDMLNHFFILAFYMPMIAATGGNTGSQSASMIIRALALGEVTFKDFFKVISKEFRTAALMGFGLGTFILLRIIIFPGTDPGVPVVEIAAAISLAIFIQVITSSVAGASLPLIATKLKIDPAVMSSPVLASVVDISGLLIYFNIAKLFLGYLLP
jgi:magnesium transporter